MANQSSYYGSDIVNQLSYKHVHFASDRDSKYRHLVPSSYSHHSDIPTDEAAEQSQNSGEKIDVAVYYKQTVIPSLVNVSKHLLEPPNFSKEAEALELCEENRFCIKNQQKCLQRIENDNILKRQEAAAKLAKMRLFQKSNQFKTKKQSENGKISVIEEESEKPSLTAIGAAETVPEISGHNFFAANTQFVDPTKNGEHSIKDNGFIVGHNSAGSEHRNLKSATQSRNRNGEVSVPTAQFYSNIESNQSISCDSNSTTHCSKADIIVTNIDLAKATGIQPAPGVLSTSPLQTAVPTTEARSISTPTPQYFSEGLRVAPDSERPGSSHFINFSDFESDSTPFDAVAIQSVNDKEELEQIFRVGVASNQPQTTAANFGGSGASNHREFELIQNFPYHNMYGQPSQHKPAAVSGSSNFITGQNRPDNYYNHKISQESNHANANFLKNAAAFTNNNTNATSVGFDALRDLKNTEIPSNDFSRPQIQSHTTSGTSLESFLYLKQQPIQQNVASDSFSMPRMTTDYNSFSAYLPLTTKTYTSPLNSINSAIYEGNGQSVATTIGHTNTGGQLVKNQSFTTTHAPIPNTSHVQKIPSAHNQTSSLIPSGPRSLSPRSESNLNCHPQSATTTTSLLSSTEKDFNYGANNDFGGLLSTARGGTSFEQGPVTSSGYGNTYKRKNMPQSKVPVVAGAPSGGTQSISFGGGGGFGGMKSAKSVGDLSSLIPEDVHFDSCISSTSSSHSRTANFNIYYPMSSHLAIKR